MKFETIPFIRRTWGALSAIVSSILTSILYEELANCSYEVVRLGDSLRLNQISEHNFFQKCLLIILIFLFIWAIISVTIPLLYYVMRRFRYRNRRKFRKSDVLKTYQSSKEDIRYLLEKVWVLGRNDCDSAGILYSEEISLIIIKLYSTFCPGKRYLDNIVKSTFRTGETVYEIGRYISPFEYDEVICAAEKLLNLFSDSQTSMLSSDYLRLKEQIDALKQVDEFLAK